MPARSRAAPPRASWRRGIGTESRYSTATGLGGGAVAGRASTSSQSKPGGAASASRRSTSPAPSVRRARCRRPRSRPSIPSPSARAKTIFGRGVNPWLIASGNLRPPHHPLQAAHDVVMANQAKIPALGESETQLGGCGHVLRSVAARANELLVDDLPMYPACVELRGASGSAQGRRPPGLDCSVAIAAKRWLESSDREVIVRSPGQLPSRAF